MSISKNIDKNIVDRSKSHRNSAVSKTVRASRERLQTGSAPDAIYIREALALYLNTILQSAAVPSLLICIAAAGGLYFSREPDLVLWALIGLIGSAVVVFKARQVNKNPITFDSVPKTTRLFLTLHLFIGVFWAVFAFDTCTTCETSSYTAYKGVILLFFLATTAMSTMMLRGSLLISSLPIVLALGASAVLHRSTDVIVEFILFCAAAAFFLWVSDRLRTSHLMLLSFQTEKDSLIAELEMANSVSDEARRRAEEANLAKSRFLASMSHELRTPLNAILGFSEVMANEVLGPMENKNYREYCSDINRSGKHLLNLINEILDLSRIEAGKYDLAEQPLSLAEIAEDSISMVELKATNKAIELECQCEENMPPVWGDERAIRQVVLNLLSNAVKFTPRDGRIRLRVGWTTGGGQYVSIRDNGPGIAEEEIPVVLSAFGQGSIAIKSAEQGTGLGLPIVQAIMAKHDGEFVLSSKLREGTETLAIFPKSRVMSRPGEEDGPRRADPLDKAGSASERPNLRKKTITA